MKTLKKTALSLLLAVLWIACACAEAALPASLSDPDAYLAYRKGLAADAPYIPFAYENDPAENPAAMADAAVNPDAVFGFSPSPASTRLKDYADALDWTDPEAVSQARETRRAYHESMTELYRMIEDMLAEAGLTAEQAA